MFREAGLTILRLMPSYAGLIYEALPGCMREFDVWVRLGRSGFNSRVLDRQAVPLLSGGG